MKLLHFPLDTLIHDTGTLVFSSPNYISSGYARDVHYFLGQLDSDLHEKDKEQ